MVARDVALHPVHDGGQDLVGLVFQTPIILEGKEWVRVVTEINRLKSKRVKSAEPYFHIHP